MRLGILVIGASLLVGSAGIAGAVNCKQVNKYLSTGRSVKDVAETMVISESDVKKCQDEAGAEAGKTGDAKPGEAAGGGGTGEQKK
jgi:hypothetical protein